MCTCVHVCVCLCACVRVHGCKCVHVYVCMYVYAFMYVCMYVCARVRMFMCVFRLISVFPSDVPLSSSAVKQNSCILPHLTSRFTVTSSYVLAVAVTDSQSLLGEAAFG